MADKRNLFYANIPFGYNRSQLDRHQVFELANQPNDERLQALKYMKPVSKSDTLHTCPECGADFVTMAGLEAHFRRSHTEMSEQQMDSVLDREDAMNSMAGVGAG